MSRPLPHIGSSEHTVLCTMWLAGSLSVTMREEIRHAQSADVLKHGIPSVEEANPDQRADIQKRHLKRLEDALRAWTGPKWLSADPVAAMVAEAIKFRDGSLYELEAFIVMPNYIHLLITPRTTGKGGPPIDYISTLILNLKKHTGKLANEILGTKGVFWDADSLIYLVRDESELFRINDFILQNPVNAGLVEHWQGWKWVFTKYPRPRLHPK